MDPKDSHSKTALSKKIQDDMARAKKICDDLRAGKPGAIEELFVEFHSEFRLFAKYKFSSYSQFYLDDVIGRFWLKVLEDQIVCDYLKPPDASGSMRKGGGSKGTLKGFLKTVLYFQLVNEQRALKRTDSRKEKYSKHQREHEPPTPTPDAVVLNEEKKTLIKKALALLAESDPVAARRIRKVFYHEEGYRTLAEKELAGTNPSDEEIRKREQAIRKQFTRKDTGHLAKLRIILQRISD